MESNRLDLIPGKIAPVVHASQYDVGRVFRIYLYDGTAPFTLNGSETITCAIRKTDNNIVVLNVENTASNYVDIVTTEQSTACAGQNICELRIEDGDTNIGTMDFILQVESDPTEGGIESETEINNLRTQVSEMVSEEVASQYDAEAVVFDNAPTAGHGNGYAVTSSGLKSALDSKANTSSLATVATSGSYNDLNNKPVIDSSLSNSSTNAVQNKVVKSAIDAKANTASLATVATSGSYNDLSNKPVIDSSLSASSTNAVQNKIVKTALDTKANTSSLATVATSGSYGDLLNKPMTEQGTVNNINFSGLAHGLYRCYVPTNSTGTPASNIGGHCLTFINDSVNYGSQILFSNLGLYWRNRSGGSWGTWKTIITP